MSNTSTDCCCSLLQCKSLFAFSSLVVFGEKAQSAHIITFYFYFHQEHSKAHLHSNHIHTVVLFHSFSLFPLYLYLFLSFPSSHLLSLSFFLFVYLSSLRSAFHVTPLGGVAEGGLMASLSGVLAAILLQLLGGHTRSTSWASVVGGYSSSSGFVSSFF